MSSNDYSSHKQYFKPTSHKSDFSFSSPQQEAQTISKQALMESRRVEIMRNRIQLFTDLKENAGLVSLINKSYSKEFVQQMRTQQRVQVEKLLLEISRLHDMLEDQERSHRYAIQRLKQQSQQIALLRISNLKQSQFSQIQMIQIQFKKTKQALEQKTFLLQEMQKVTSRKIQNLTNQNQILKNDLKIFIEKKNVEIFSLKNQFNKQTENQVRKNEQALQQMKNLTDKQLKKIVKKLQQKEKDVQSLKQKFEINIRQKQNIQQAFEKQKIELIQKLQRNLQQQRQRQNQVIENLKKFYDEESGQNQVSMKLQRQMMDAQIKRLLEIIKIKDNQSQRSLIFRQTQKIDFKLQFKNLQNQNNYLKTLIKQLKNQQLQEIQLLKVKMASLHQNDIQSLVRLYEAKIQSLTKDLQLANKESDRITKQMKIQRQKVYQMKKKYNYSISVLSEEILQLKLGMGHFEKDMKQKLQNQKSMMIMTSRNFIKENELKNNNIRFYEQQLRKLRQLLQIQAQQVQQSERNVEQKIKLAEDQLTRLSNKILEVKSQAQQTQKKLKQIIQQKNLQIKKLNDILNNPKIINKGEDDKRSQLKRLDQQLAKKQDQIRSLLNKCENLQNDIKNLKTQNERLILQGQINSEQAKKHYKTLSDKNLADFKAFYDRRLQQLQNDKKQLGKVNSSQSQQMTELIKKFKQLQQGMRQLLKQSKKRTDLQARIISLGTDNNLVKNMAELFHK